MEIIDNGWALLLRLKNPQTVTAHIPASRIVGKEPSGSHTSSCEVGTVRSPSTAQS